jgi:hypothetical protein
MEVTDKKWFKFSLLNILIVAAIGLIMRYKIGFDLPLFEQKYLQNAHSHFAFAGWITHTIYVLMLFSVGKFIAPEILRKYRIIIAINLILAYGMLFTFFTMGYCVFSIVLSQLSVINNYVFAFFFIRDLRAIPQHPSVHWFKAALWFNVLSTLGTYTLAYMMASKHVLQSLYLGSIYFYLHFQYNGWFFFACMGLLIARLSEMIPGMKENKNMFRLLMLSCVPAFFLSVLWLNLPTWLYVIVVAAAAVQFMAWIGMLKFLVVKFKQIKNDIKISSSFIFLLIATSLTIKFSLQLGSVVPSISDLAFGFRPIVIAYLHLVLLAVITLFLLNYLMAFQFLKPNKMARYGLMTFVVGVFLNELCLGIQGVAAFSYTLVPMVNEALFGVTVLIFLALIALFISQLKQDPR